MELRITKKQVTQLLIIILGFALLARLAIGMGLINPYDTYWYRGWAVDLPINGLFDVYARADSITLDYPPLYLFPLYLTGLAYKAFGIDCGLNLQMLLMKFWPIIFDVACAGLLYLICYKKYGRPVGLLAAFLWCLNPSTFFNTAAWGQTDSIMAFLLLLSFWYLEENRPIAACIAFAVAGLTKFQCLFFLPPFLLVLLFRNLKDLKRVLFGLLAAAGTVLAVFLPFMIGAKNPLLFFDVYLGSAGKYPYCSLNAYNLYSMLGLNWSHDVKDTDPILGGFLTWNHISAVLLLLSLALLIILYVVSYRRHGTKRLSGWVGGLLFMQCIFMLTTRMHERYQIVVLPFALMAWVVTHNKRFMGLFAALSGITLINQFFILLSAIQSRQYKSNAFWLPANDAIDIIFSSINLLIFIWTVYECVRYFLGSRPKDRLPEGGPAISKEV